MPRTNLPKGSVPVSFRLPRDIKQLLRDKARRGEMSFSELIRRALGREITTAPSSRPPLREKAANREAEE
jgi:hypothetical protein